MPNSNTGFGTGFTSVPYETITEYRRETLDANIFINTIRAEYGTEVTFKDILAPKITETDIAYGCGKLPDMECLQAYEFKAEVNKQRLMDVIDDPCNWSNLENLRAVLLNKISIAWANAELNAIFKFIAGALPVAKATIGANPYDLIEDLVMETSEQMEKDMGELAPDKSELIVVLSPRMASALRKQGFACCKIADASRKGDENVWGVKGVYEVDRAGVLEDANVLVYHPKLKFQVTKCQTDPNMSSVNIEGHAPQSTRIFGRELFGFEEFQVPTASDLSKNVKVHAGVKYTGPTVAPAPTPETE